MAFFDTISVSVTVFSDTEFSVTDHGARNFLTHFLYQRFHDTLVSKKCLHCNITYALMLQCQTICDSIISK